MREHQDKALRITGKWKVFEPRVNEQGACVLYSGTTRLQYKSTAGTKELFVFE